MSETQEIAQYQLLQPFYVDDTLIDNDTKLPSGEIVPTVIEYEGEPNEAMVPINASAKAAMEKFLQKLATGNKAAGWNGNRTPSMDEQVGRAMAERPREMPTLPGKVPPMPNTLYENRAFKADPTKETAKVVEPPSGMMAKPRRIMGTAVREEPIAKDA